MMFWIFSNIVLNIEVDVLSKKSAKNRIVKKTEHRPPLAHPPKDSNIYNAEIPGKGKKCRIVKENALIIQTCGNNKIPGLPQIQQSIETP